MMLRCQASFVSDRPTDPISGNALDAKRQKKEKEEGMALQKEKNKNQQQQQNSG